MSRPSLRNPLKVGLGLWAALAGLAALHAVVVCLTVRALSEVEPLDRLVVCGRVLVLLAVTVALQALAVAEMVRRTAPLYRAARRDSRDEVPPSQAALRDALAAPHWLAAVTAGPGVFSGVAVLASGGGVLDARGGGVPLAAFVASVSVALAVPAGAAARASVAGWLVAFRPDQQVLHDTRVAIPSLSTLTTLPVLGLGGAVLAVSMAADLGVPMLVAAALVAATVIAVWVAAHRAQRRLEDDERALASGLADATAALASGPARRVALAERAWRTAEVAEVAAATDAMAKRYATLAREEDRARASVQELQRSKMLFMASMSHDLRSPLNSILGFGELLQQSGERNFNDSQRESVRLIARSGEELLRLLNDVLDSARYEAGRLQLRRDWTPSVEILTEAVRQARDMVEDEQLEIVAEMQAGLPPVYVDRERIVQAVVGLFRHAARAMTGGTIRMYARVAPDPVTGTDQLRVDVVDRSGGIRDEDRERIFEAFREVTSVSGRRIGGLGLSLSLARALVRAHAGDVWIDNEPGRGTTFTVAIPISGG